MPHPISEAAALFIDELQRDPNAKLTEQTIKQNEAVYRLFKDFTKDAPLTAIDRSIAASFLNTIAKLDPHWGRSPKAKEKTLAQLMTEYGTGEGQLTNKTINRYVSSLSELFRWARKQGQFDGENPFTDQSRAKPDAGKSGWLRFETEELNKLFGSPLFKDTNKAERVNPKQHSFETAFLWVPLIALYGGMRLGEICQLHKSDVQRKDGVWVFNVSTEHEGQQLKTEAAERIVPVHSMLIGCGFLEYVKALPKGQLFPGLKPGGPDAKMSWYFTQRFTAYRRKVGINRPRVVFHSFRKNAAQALKDKRSTPAEIAELIGHEQGFTLSTYAPMQLPIPVLKELIERVSYKGLMLSHLYVA